MFCRLGSVDDSRPVDGDGLVERRMQPAGDRIEQQRQRLDVGAAQLGVVAPLEDLVDRRVGGAQVLEHAGVGRVARLRAPAAGQVELVEQDLLELLGAADGELVADVHEDLLLQPRDLLGEGLRQAGQRLTVDGHAGRLHLGEHRDQRQLDLVEHRAERRLFVEVLLEGLAGSRRPRRPVGRRGRGRRAHRPVAAPLRGARRRSWPASGCAAPRSGRRPRSACRRQSAAAAARHRGQAASPGAV